MKTFKVTWECQVTVTRQAYVNAETESQARDAFDNGEEYGACTLEEQDDEASN